MRGRPCLCLSIPLRALRVSLCADLVFSAQLRKESRGGAEGAEKNFAKNEKIFTFALQRPLWPALGNRRVILPFIIFFLKWFDWL
jgi:hypothetical protein